MKLGRCKAQWYRNVPERERERERERELAM
jgi:hypothetical protein